MTQLLIHLIDYTIELGGIRTTICWNDWVEFMIIPLN